MALPPGFLDDLRQRLTLSDIAGRKVTWDARKSNPAKGDFWAPCPFHQEKTASFHVDDRKGFYYCFGCHAKGDMISFVKETDNVSFIESVEILAREAGVDMPAQTRDPRAAEARDRRTRLADVMEQAVQAYGLAFRSAAAAPIRDYVRGRGLTGETAKTFEIGFAPDNRTALTDMFKEKGVLDDAIAAGMVIKPEDGGNPYDRFRGRLMFPIRDPRGRCIAFGGRAMDPNARAKYLNSPETELFHKSRVLYNHGPAREAAGKTGALIVAEGYMDVIALAQAGFRHAVAPLGTAITEEQLGLMWRITDEPVIALDGDKAGLRAAERLVDLALPMLSPGKSLRFCIMPEGRDPDDLIKAEGPGAMQAAIEEAVPLIEMLWRREVERETLDTPERRAAMDQRLKQALGRIGDAGVRNHYAADLRERRAQLFAPKPRAQAPAALGQTGPARRTGQGRGGRYVPTRPVRETLSSDLARKGSAQEADTRIRESAILLIALKNPEAARQLEAALEAMAFVAPDMAQIRDRLMDALADETDPVEHIHQATGEDPVAMLSRIPQARAHPQSRPGPVDQVVPVLAEAIERHQAFLTHTTEIGDARRDLADADDESWSVRVHQANQERLEADSRGVAKEDEAISDSGESIFQRMLDNEAWRRSSKKRQAQ
ncbi:MAG: DNA primase [Pseudomonadota bacterium]